MIGRGELPGESGWRSFGLLVGMVEATPDIITPELATWLEAERQVQADPAVLSRLRNRRQPRMRLEPRRLLFADETSVNTKMVRLRSRSLRDHRLRADTPFGPWSTQPSSRSAFG